MGFTSSSSSSPSTSYSSQSTTAQSATGGTGDNSPTIFSGGAVSLTDAGQTSHAIDSVTTLGEDALSLLSDFNGRSAQAQVESNKSALDLLSSVLSNNQTLAQNVQSGGATVGMALTTKIVWGVLALAGAVIAFLLFRKGK